MIDYDIVIATRNRQSILTKSLPLFLAQTRLPKRLIVVDSSDDHQSLRAAVNGAFRNRRSKIELQIIQSQAGSSRQRNAGLRLVDSPVVVFPDDDSLWFEDSAENLMRVYECDAEGELGCVAFSVAPSYPPASFGADAPPYEIETRDHFARKVSIFVGSFEQRFMPDPIDPGDMWMDIWGRRACPPWMGQAGAQLCGPVFGYRMSFRTSVIRSIGGFDESLGRYAMFEDSDATIGALCHGLNATATHARVHHYRAPGQRVTGWEFGMMAILNRTYVVCKHSPPGSRPRHLVRKYLRYKVARYLAQSYSQYGRMRLMGALRSLSRTDELLGTPIEQVSDSYVRIREALRKT